MRSMQTVIDLGRSVREKRGISLKTPVKGITVVCKDEEVLKALEKLQGYVKGELNAWEVSKEVLENFCVAFGCPIKMLQHTLSIPCSCLHFNSMIVKMPTLVYHHFGFFPGF